MLCLNEEVSCRHTHTQIKGGGMPGICKCKKEQKRKRRRRRKKDFTKNKVASRDGVHNSPEITLGLESASPIITTIIIREREDQSS